MRSNGKRAGEWSDEEYHRRKAREEKDRQNAPGKPGNVGRTRESDFPLGGMVKSMKAISGAYGAILSKMENGQ